MAIVRAHVETGRGDRARRGLSGADRSAGAACRDAPAGARDRARDRAGCSVGIGPNKLVAKVASDAEKPRGFVVLTPRAGVRALRRRRCGLVPGIGPKTAERLRALRDRHAGQAAPPPPGRAGRPRSAPRLGAELQRRARFEDDAPVTAGAQGRSPSHARRRSTTTSPASTALEPVLARLVDAAVRGAERQQRARPHDRDQGPAGRLLDPHPRAHAGRAGEHRGPGRAGRAGAAAPVRAAAAGAAARRAGRRARAGAVDAEQQLTLLDVSAVCV